MNGTPFKLATFAKPDGSRSPPSCWATSRRSGGSARGLSRLRARGALSATASISGLLENWEANFPALQEIVAFLEKEGLKPGAANGREPAALPPVTRPGKMFYAAQNFQEHVDEMIRAGMSPAGGPKFTGEKSTTRALSVPEGAELPCRRQRRHRGPARHEEDRLGGRDRAAPSASRASASRPSARSITSRAS